MRKKTTTFVVSNLVWSWGGGGGVLGLTVVWDVGAVAGLSVHAVHHGLRPAVRQQHLQHSFYLSSYYLLIILPISESPYRNLLHVYSGIRLRIILLNKCPTIIRSFFPYYKTLIMRKQVIHLLKPNFNFWLKVEPNLVWSGGVLRLSLLV